MKGAYPQILNDPLKGVEARRPYADAQTLLAEIIAGNKLTARAVIGLYPAASLGDDVVFYADESREQTAAVFSMLRQQFDRGAARPCYSLADFVAPAESGVADYAGVFALTTGIGVDELVACYQHAHDDYHAIMVKVLADRLVEALAEYMHAEVRKRFWGYAPNEELTNEELIAEKYRGIRPAPGYPAAPDHTEKRRLFDLLAVPDRIDLHLTENCAMVPTAAVSGFYFAHPDATYFSVGRIGRDQVEDYAGRKGMSVAEAERWLRPNLEYDA
jgi:5-methyltetrahydrofolate--homocysteine methyltransferase